MVALLRSRLVHLEFINSEADMLLIGWHEDVEYVFALSDLISSHCGHDVPEVYLFSPVIPSLLSYALNLLY